MSWLVLVTDAAVGHGDPQLTQNFRFTSTHFSLIRRRHVVVANQM